MSNKIIIENRIALAKSKLRNERRGFSISSESLESLLTVFKSGEEVSLSRFMLDAKNVASAIERCNILEIQIEELESLLVVIDG